MKLIKEIISKDGVVHFRRWSILSTKLFSIYLHGIYKADEDKHLHDHPWNFISIIVKGFYTEQTKTGSKVRGPMSIAARSGKAFHKIKSLESKSVYSLFFVGRRYKAWGYDVDGKWTDNVQYRELKNNNKL